METEKPATHNSDVLTVDPPARPLSEGRKPKRLSEEHKENIRRANVGKKHTEEAKAKISRTNLGKEISEEHKARLRECNTGSNNHVWDVNIDQVKLAIRLHVSGLSMREASRRLNFNHSWLTGWKARHRERFHAIYAAEAEKRERDLIGKAVAILAISSVTMEEAGRRVGLPDNLLENWAQDNQEDFEKLRRDSRQEQLMWAGLLADMGVYEAGPVQIIKSD